MIAKLATFAFVFLASLSHASAQEKQRSFEDSYFKDLKPLAHPDFCAAIVIHPERIVNSPLGQSIDFKKLFANLLADAPFKETGNFLKLLDQEKIHRLTVFIDPLPGGNLAFDPVVTVQFRRETSGKALIRSLWPKARPSAEVDGLFISLEDFNGADLQGYVADPHTVVIASELSMGKLLSRRSSTFAPLRRQLDHQVLQSEFVLIYTNQPLKKKLLDLTGMDIIELRHDPDTDEAIKTVALDVTSLSMQINLLNSQSINVEAELIGPNFTKEIEQAFLNGLEIANVLAEDAAARKEFKNEMLGEIPTEVLNLINDAAFRDIVKSFETKSTGKRFSVSLLLPKSALILAETKLNEIAGAKAPSIDSGRWTVLFRSNDPKIWNSSTNEGPNRFAVPISNAPANTKYLRLKRETGQYVIIELNKSQIGKRFENGQIGWVGTNHFQWNGHHLGIYNKKWTDQIRGSIQIWPLQNRGIRGWGFGNRTQIDDRQGHSWEGVSLSRTVFEISVTTEQLTLDEQKNLLR